jgi:hypothetical protein
LPSRTVAQRSHSGAEQVLLLLAVSPDLSGRFGASHSSVPSSPQTTQRTRRWRLPQTNPTALPS